MSTLTPQKQSPLSVFGGGNSNPSRSQNNCPSCTEENSKLTMECILPKNTVVRNHRTLSGGRSNRVYLESLIETNETGEHVANHPPVSPFDYVVGLDYEATPVVK